MTSQDYVAEPFDLPGAGRMAVLSDPAALCSAPGRREITREPSSGTSRQAVLADPQGAVFTVSKLLERR
jgi:hypothetical protein